MAILYASKQISEMPEDFVNDFLDSLDSIKSLKGNVLRIQSKRHGLPRQDVPVSINVMLDHVSNTFHFIGYDVPFETLLDYEVAQLLEEHK